MNQNNRLKSLFQYYVRWIFLSSLIGVACGIASATFLFLLETVTSFRNANSWLLYLLPVGGLIVGWIYHRYGKKVESGNNLIIDEFHDPQAVIPFRMAPLVLLGTLLTHLFGGSAGREGTAVQMGGSIADQFAHFFKMSREERQTLLMAGMSGGFGSVFGVPFAGTVFGLEVLSVGRLHLWAVVECAVAAFVAHYVTLALGIHHTQYVHPLIADITPISVSISLAAGVAFGLAARTFSMLTDFIRKISKSTISYLPVRALVGGAIISLLFFLVPTLTRYAGLGVPIIVDSLQTQLPIYDWFGKLGMTALTLGVGFKGGEVTPLLFVGATLGNALSLFLPLALPLLASMGFVAVFAGAANTPFACTLMAMELFGPRVFVYAAIACFVSYLISGHHGIYPSQTIHLTKVKYFTRGPNFLFKRPLLKSGALKSGDDV